MKHSEEYERKMANGLHSSFLSLYCVLGILLTIVAVGYAIIDALVEHRWIELLAIPTGAIIVCLCIWGIGASQRWGLRNLDEARVLGAAEWEMERQKQEETCGA